MNMDKMQMWTVISKSTLPPATEIYPKNSRMMRGDFQIQKYILAPNCKAKSDFCDHEAATLLFIEIADMRMLFRMFVERWRPRLQTRGLLKPELNL